MHYTVFIIHVMTVSLPFVHLPEWLVSLSRRLVTSGARADEGAATFEGPRVLGVFLCIVPRPQESGCAIPSFPAFRTPAEKPRVSGLGENSSYLGFNIL